MTDIPMARIGPPFAPLPDQGAVDMRDDSDDEFDAIIAQIKAIAAEHEKQMALQCGMTVEELRAETLH